MVNNVAVGKVFIHLKIIDSTNAYARQLLSKTKPAEGTVIFADEQTSGKGQLNKHWESEAGKNLTFSVILYPDFLNTTRIHALSQAVSLSLLDFFHSFQISTTIKWPNDIYEQDKKLAGILIENALVKENLSYSIIGIGINVNQTVFNPELLNPVSMKLIQQKEFELKPLLESYFPFLEKRYFELKAGEDVKMKQEYRSNLYGLMEKRTFETAQKKFEGMITGVDANGRLMIETDEDVLKFSTNEVVYL